MNQSSTETIIQYLANIGPTMEIRPADLMPGKRYALPPCFTISLYEFDERIILHGPDNATTELKTLTRHGGEFRILGLQLIQAVARVLQVGPPVWDKSFHKQFDWWLQEIRENAEPFIMPEPAPMDLAQAELHIGSCQLCAPVHDAYVKALDAGVTSLMREAEWLRMVERAHAGPADAVRYYEGLAQAMQLPVSVGGQRKRKETVPA